MMASKRSLFGGKPGGGGLHADPEDRAAPGDREPAERAEPREAGAQRGASHPGDPNIPGAPNDDVDLLDDGRRAGGWRSGIAIVALLSVFAGGLWYAYDWAMAQLGTTRLPLIVADTTPIKSRPQDPGGIEVPNQDVTVLNDVAPDPDKPQAERLLPPPEAPQMTPTQVSPQVAAQQTAAVTTVEQLLGPPLKTAAGPPGKMPAAEETPLPAVPAAVPAAGPEIAAAPEPLLPEPKTETLLAPAPPPAPSVATPSAAATSEPAPQVTALPDAKTGGFLVQLAALRAEDGARPAWTRLQKAHPALLGDRELAIQRVDLGDRGIFYRVQAGYFADRISARALCNALKARGQDCLVVKR
jgi:cell division septation protein DedD